MTIIYRLGNSLYLNITNRCPCACVFCIRNLTDSVGDAETLWLEREPTVEEVKLALDRRQDINHINEFVFCGYGEPMARANELIEISAYIKEQTGLKVRVNTNGLVKLLVPSFEINRWANVVDSLSVSLNADDAEEYVRLVNPEFGLRSYNAMMDFVKEAKKYTDVTLTVLEDLAPQRIENCRRIARDLKLPLRVRTFI
ncbi:MAG: TatD family nuclease-associated radical SAM protein [Firmicutes bacterium]|nr:TatD family nuclease-associated radical SAM protein [Bacillota bacterium]